MRLAGESHGGNSDQTKNNSEDLFHRGAPDTQWARGRQAEFAPSLHCADIAHSELSGVLDATRKKVGTAEAIPPIPFRIALPASVRFPLRASVPGAVALKSRSNSPDPGLRRGRETRVLSRILETCCRGLLRPEAIQAVRGLRTRVGGLAHATSTSGDRFHGPHAALDPRTGSSLCERS